MAWRGWGNPVKYSLREKQSAFAKLAAELIKHAYSQGYEITFGEAYRPPETAKIYARQGRGIKNSLHCKRLALDINLFKKGKYLTDSKDYEFLGEYWEDLATPGLKTCWGGRFRHRDGNHFSIAHGGYK
jgi:hypothetical protein